MFDSVKKTRVIIVRHSERWASRCLAHCNHMNQTAWDEMCLPDPCVVLSEQLAFYMADQTGERIARYNPTRLYSSPWLRCLQTASSTNVRVHQCCRVVAAKRDVMVHRKCTDTKLKTIEVESGLL